jgi:cytoskeleton protein RodZ
VASFGVRLKQEREQRGVTLEEISSTTKIGTRMLQALEEDHFDQLPGGIFNKGFIRAYARCLGLDEEQAIADYLVASGNVPSEKDKDKKSDGVSTTSSFELQAEAERESNVPWGTFAILLVLAALGFAAWGVYSRSKSNRKAEASGHASPPASTTSAALPPVVTSPANTSALSSPSIQTKTQSTKPISAAAATMLQNQPPPAVPKPLSLHIVLHADSWLSITADGNPVLQGSSFSAPTEKTIHAAREIVVKAGNVGALDLEFNGKKLPAQGADGEVKTLTFDATGLRPPTSQPEAPDQHP